MFIQDLIAHFPRSVNSKANPTCQRVLFTCQRQVGNHWCQCLMEIPLLWLRHTHGCQDQRSRSAFLPLARHTDTHTHSEHSWAGKITHHLGCVNSEMQTATLKLKRLILTQCQKYKDKNTQALLGVHIYIPIHTHTMHTVYAHMLHVTTTAALLQSSGLI